MKPTHTNCLQCISSTTPAPSKWHRREQRTEMLSLRRVQPQLRQPRQCSRQGCFPPKDAHRFNKSCKSLGSARFYCSITGSSPHHPPARLRLRCTSVWLGCVQYSRTFPIYVLVHLYVQLRNIKNALPLWCFLDSCDVGCRVRPFASNWVRADEGPMPW